MNLSSVFRGALERRADLLVQLHQEQTDCYRLFHGVAEGFPGLCVDRYGSLIFLQFSDRHELSQKELSRIAEEASQVFSSGGVVVAALRVGPSLELLWESVPGAWTGVYWVREFGLRFAVQPSRAHRDLQLFLDARSLKRGLLKRVLETQERFGPSPALLNLFSYTCSIGCQMVARSSVQAWNVDFSSGNLKWGEKNARKNRLSRERIHFLESDCIGFMRSLMGVPTGSRRPISVPEAMRGLQFPFIVLDPPVFSKGRFGTVDMLRAPEAVIEPAWTLLAPGGSLLVTNNSAKMGKVEFEERLQRFLDPPGTHSPAVELDWLSPDQDFPSFDGEYPLKVVLCRKVG